MELDISKAEEIGGWMSPTELEFLAGFARSRKRILEIGSFLGRSTRALADNSPQDAIVDCVDPWDFVISSDNTEAITVGPQSFSMFYHNLKDHIKAGKVTPYQSLFKHFKATYKYDFIFIDGAHDEASVRHDIEKSLTIVEPGGYISGHDYAKEWLGVPAAVHSFFGKPDGVTDSIWWVKVS